MKHLTSHQFARHLLDGPDLPILMHKVKSYAEEDGASPLVSPLLDVETATDENEQPFEAVIIDQSSECQHCISTPCMCGQEDAIKGVLKEMNAASEARALAKP